MTKPEGLDAFIDYVIREDLGDGDHTSLATIPESASNTADLWAKETGIIAGVELAQILFTRIDPDLQTEIFIKDGSPVIKGDKVLSVMGSVHSILQAERLVLNFMQRMSGIATKTQTYLNAIRGFPVKIMDTRKTTPGLRFLEKWAVRLGGGTNHRFGLYDMILIKDNHIDFSGGIRPALERVRDYQQAHGFNLQVEIETRNLEEVQEVLDVGLADIIMLDNFEFGTCREAVELIHNRAKVEASGNITLETIRDYAACGVDYISSGSLTHSVKSLDLSLKAR